MLTLSFLSLPASHLCHQGLGWPCIIVTFIIYQQLNMTLRQQISFSSGSIFTQGQGRGAHSLFFYPFILSGSLFTLQPSPTILAEVTIYPGGQGEGAYRLMFLTIYFIRVTIYLAMLSHNISRGHYLPCNTYCLVLACIKATIHIKPLRFCHDLSNI